MDNKEIQNFIKFVSKSNVAEVVYKTNDFEISVKNNFDKQQIISHNISSNPIVSDTLDNINTKSTDFVDQNSISDKSNGQKSISDKYVVIKSPMIGTFYRKPSPDKNYFVNVGDTISIGTVVCVVEAMKLFNEIESDISGKIVDILVEDKSPVEFDQPLFIVDPL